MSDSLTLDELTRAGALAEMIRTSFVGDMDEDETPLERLNTTLDVFSEDDWKLLLRYLKECGPGGRG